MSEDFPLKYLCWFATCLKVLIRVWMHPWVFSSVQLCVTPWTVVFPALLSMGFYRQEYWKELLFLTPGDLPDPEIEPVSPALAGRFFTTELPGKPLIQVHQDILMMKDKLLIYWKHVLIKFITQNNPDQWVEAGQEAFLQQDCIFNNFS